MMNTHPDGVGRGGRASQGGQEECGGQARGHGQENVGKVKEKDHTLSMEAIKHNVFECRQAELMVCSRNPRRMLWIISGGKETWSHC
jgi:hypothetical protein